MLTESSRLLKIEAQSPAAQHCVLLLEQFSLDFWAGILTCFHSTLCPISVLLQVEKHSDKEFPNNLGPKQHLLT
jgi:hypothetical protein